MIIYILGLDGAGKTTLARRLAAAGLPGRRVRYLYCQHQPRLLLAPRWAARRRFLRGSDPGQDYDRYRRRKAAAACRYPRLARCYAWLWCVDAALQTWPRIRFARRRADVVLVDRYYLDWVVNLGVLGLSSVGAMLSAARQLERLLPKAQVHVFLDVAEEICFGRKDDIPSVQYLRERSERYRQLAPHYGFQVVDANRAPDLVYREVEALVRAAASWSPAAPDERLGH